jgi:hypothetical protein
MMRNGTVVALWVIGDALLMWVIGDALDRTGDALMLVQMMMRGTPIANIVMLLRMITTMS